MLVLFIYITRLASNEIFSPSNKIYREVGRAKDLSAHLYADTNGGYCGEGLSQDIHYALMLLDPHSLYCSLYFLFILGQSERTHDAFAWRN